jgi:hypothetical protein
MIEGDDDAGRPSGSSDPIQWPPAPSSPSIQTQGSIHFSFAAEGFCVWVFKDKQWVERECHCGRDFGCGDPPSDEGQYEGQLVRKGCDPAQSRE